MPNVINATSTGNGGLISTGDDSGILNIQTNETTAITVDASQNVGIGTATPVSQNGKVLQIDGGATAADLRLTNNATGSAKDNGVLLGLAGSDAYLYNFENAFMAFGTNAAERMRITSSGAVCVATTSQIDFGLISVAANLDLLYHLVLKNTATQAGGQSYQRFLNSANAKTGSIDHTGTTTVAYTTSSDYRLKENIAPMTGALTAVLQLKPCTYTWKEDGKVGQGFIAHELQEVCPDCVSGNKDAIDEHGNPEYQGIDTSFLVATLTAALQETKALIDTQAETINALTARIVALESRGTV